MGNRNRHQSRLLEQALGPNDVEHTLFKMMQQQKLGDYAVQIPEELLAVEDHEVQKILHETRKQEPQKQQSALVNLARKKKRQPYETE